jgi:hypothetical protein
MEANEFGSKKKRAIPVTGLGVLYGYEMLSILRNLTKFLNNIFVFFYSAVKFLQDCKQQTRRPMRVFRFDDRSQDCTGL